MATTTWNPSDKTASVTLTGSNLIATASAGTSQGVRAIDKQIAGKFYWECALTTATGLSTGVGVVSSTYNLGVLPGSGMIQSCVLLRSGNIWNEGVSGVSFGTITAGTVICIAVDCTARLIWFRLGAAGNWNTSASANPATGAGGVSIALGVGVPLFPAALLNANSDQITANFGGSAFTGAVPSGFTSGFTAGATTSTNAIATQVAVEQFVAPNPAAQVTQVGVEQFIALNPYAQVTQVALEEWGYPSPQAQATQVALEEWASAVPVVAPTGGFLGFSPGVRTSGNAGAASIFLTKVTAQQNGVANAFLIDLFSAPSGSYNFRALVYDGAHSVLLAQSAITQSLVIDYNRLPLLTPLTINAGTDYYVGYVCDASFVVTIQSGGATSWFASGGQSVTSPANPLAAGTSSGNGLMIALELDGTGALPYAWGTDRAVNAALSGSNRIASISAPSGANSCARSAVTHYPLYHGKWYAEIDVGGVLGAVQTGVGVASVAWGMNQTVATSNVAYCYLLFPNGILNQAATNIALTYAVGDTIGIAYDAISNLIWWNKNNGSWFGASSSAGNPTTGSGGFATQATWPAAVTVGDSANSTAATTFTLRDTQDSLRYTPPSGYAPWSSYILPTYIPPPPTPPAKGGGGQDKGKGQGGPKVKVGPPALRSEGLLEALPTPRRYRYKAPWALQPVLSQILAEAAATSATLSATVVHPAALSESAVTTAAIASGRILAATLAESVGTSSALAATTRVLGLLSEGSHGTDAPRATMVTHAALTASAVTSDVPYHGVTAPGTLSESAATSAAITALLTAHATLSEGAATSSLVAGFRTLPAGISETAAGSAAIAGTGVKRVSLAEQAATAEALRATARMLGPLAEAAQGTDAAAATAIIRAALAEATGTESASTFIATIHPLRHPTKLIGEHDTPDLIGEWPEPPETP